MVEAGGNGNNGSNGGGGRMKQQSCYLQFCGQEIRACRLVESSQTVLLNSLQAKNGCLFKMRMTNDSNIQLTAQFRHHWHLPDISNKLSVENLLSNFQQFQILTATMATVLVSRETLAFDFIKIELKLFPAFVVFKLYPPTA